MKIFLARLQGEGERARELVGIFAADDDQHLGFIVDEVTDPTYVEVLELEAGGIYWPGHVGFKIPVPTDDNGEPLVDPNLPSDYSITDGWIGDWYGPQKREWRSIDFVRE